VGVFANCRLCCDDVIKATTILGVPKYPISTLKKFGSTSLPPEVQHKAATTPENFGSEIAHKIRSPLSGHLSLESTRQMQNVLTFERFLTIHFAY
jgi:hypothetical protein